MRPRHAIQLLLTIAAIGGAFLVLQTSRPAITRNTPCKERVETGAAKKPGNDKLIWEKLSQQFFSSL